MFAKYLTSSLFVIISLVSCVCVSSADSVVKFKDNHNSVYFYSLKRNAYNPAKNTSEICSCDIELQKFPGDASKIVANLTIIEQIFHQINRPGTTERELQQIQMPFIVGLTPNGDLNSITTEQDETYRALEIKNQVVQTLMLNRTLYKGFVDGTENDFLIEVDLSTHLPLSLCNASVHVDRSVPTEYKVRLYVNAESCWELVVGNVKLTNNSKYEVVTTFDRDSLTLKELKENTAIEVEVSDGRRGLSTYEFYLKFKEFVAPHKHNTDKLTEFHGQEKLDNIVLY
ncbi:uncharacterized protein LOC134832259 [Culicoides brevitarsis]|uniref:uncharacterized protein LOC134832259 n=1 Tax=Culicoides brevitarsis TaxID=469753 RepID=UPI00307B68D9